MDSANGSSFVYGLSSAAQETDATLFVTLCVAFLTGFPLTYATLNGTLSVFKTRDCSVIDHIIIFYCLAIFQVVLISEVCVITRFAFWNTEFSYVRTLCLISYMSSTIGGLVLEISLSVVAVLRYLFIFWPHLAIAIAAKPRVFTTWIILSILTIGDLSYETHTVYTYCVGVSQTARIPIQFTSYSYVVVGYLAVVYLTDFTCTFRIWRYVSKKYRQAGLLNAVILNRRRQQNLLTATGGAVSRIFTIIPYLNFGFLQTILRDENGDFSDQLCFLIVHTVYIGCVTILLPICNMIYSPIMRKPVVSFTRYLIERISRCFHIVTFRKPHQSRQASLQGQRTLFTVVINKPSSVHPLSTDSYTTRVVPLTSHKSLSTETVVNVTESTCQN